MEETKVTKDMFKLSPAQAGQGDEMARESLTFWQDAFRRLKQNKASVISLWVIAIIIVMAIFGPVMNGFKYDQQIAPLKVHAKLPPKVPGLEKLGIMDGSRTKIKTKFDEDGNQYKERIKVNPYVEEGIEDSYFWFGTDDLARDLWTRTWAGARVSLYIAMLAAVINLVIGVTYGGVAGYFGGRIDMIMMRITEVIGGIPNLVVMIMFILVFKPGILTMSIALTITGWIGMARIVRGQILKLRGQEFVLASRTLGASHKQLILKHLIPNTVPQIVIVIMFSIPGAIFFEAFMAFIGLGLPAPNASLGVLINDGYKMLKGFPYLMIIPSTVLCILMLCMNLFANGFRDALDPKMRSK